MIPPLNEAIATGNVISILLEVWRSIGMSVAENWISFSLLLIISCVGYFLYNHIRNDTEKISRTASVIALSFANFVLCGQFYLADSYSQRWTDIQKFWNMNRIMLIVLTSIVVLALVSIMILKVVKRLKMINRELDGISPTDSDSADKTEGNDGEVEKNSDASHIKLNDKDFAWKHPFSYAWRSYCYYRSQRKEINNKFKNEKATLKKENRLECLKNRLGHKPRRRKFHGLRLGIKLFKIRNTKTGNSTSEENRVQSVMTTIVAVLCGFFSIGIIVWIVWLVCIANDDTNQYAEIPTKILDAIDSLIENLNAAENPLIQVLFAFGTVALLAILVLLIYFTSYFVLRAMFGFLTSIKEDDKRIIRFVHSIKVFSLD